MAQRYTARTHTSKVVAELYELIPKDECDKMHCILLQAPPTECRHDTDRELPFHQEANFTYMTGYPHPSACVLVCVGYTGASSSDANVFHTLFVPPAIPAETMWSVAPPTLEQAKACFDSDNITSTTDLKMMLDGSAKCAEGYLVLHTLPTTQAYPALPDLALEIIAKGGVDVEDKKRVVKHQTQYLLEALHRARLTKTDYEIELIREANRVSSGAHEVVMRELGKHARRRKEAGAGGQMRNGGSGVEKQADEGRTGKEGLENWEIEGEGDAEAVFVAACRRQGSTPAYLPICASGTRASTLHYVCNDRLFPSTAQPRQNGDKSFRRPLQRGCCSIDNHAGHTSSTPLGEYHADGLEPQVLLIDAGGEWQNYASDITRTVPVGNGGRFTNEAGEIYELVLRMQKESEAMVKPGVHWDTIHLHSHRVLIDGLLSLGILKGDPESVLQSGITSAFYPHGLGHSLGLDVHDSLQYLRSTHIDLPTSSSTTPANLYAYLRIRQPLRERMVLTVEPGCYFPPQLMEEYKVWKSDYVDQEVLRRYTGVGGVRIEDVVRVTSDGVENLTTVPRERSQVEALCSGEA